MYRTLNPLAKRGTIPAFFLLGLVVALIVSACGVASTPTTPPPTSPASPASDFADSEGKTGTVPTPSPQPSSQTGSEASGVAGSPPVVRDEPTRYQWLGQIVVSELRGIELARPCETWTYALAFASPEVESKAANLAGKKVVVWGTPSPISSRRTINVEAVYDADGPVPEVAVPEYPCPDDTREQLYSWVGVVVVSELEGRHLELDRGCDAWVLMPESDEVTKKLETYVGKKLTVWGDVSTAPSIYMRQTISVKSAHGPDDPVIALYVPEYPCPGTVTPRPPMPGPVAIDLLPGEIAAVGKLLKEGEATYLETPSDRIVLKYDASTPTAAPAGQDGETRVDAGGGSVPPSSVESQEVMVVGKWRVEDGRLVITVRYVTSWGSYVYPEPVPSPQPMPVPPEPGEGMGVLYGQVRIGPLCPVEPCRNPTPDVYSSRSLVLESEAGETLEVPLTPDGWFKVQVEAGVYVVTLTNCDFLGCKAALPQKVAMTANAVTTLEINIDTGIR
ncbi:MAG: hypothetical protein HY683_08615 [Chloroflexi bacterium]|nr:hypothetical protein [Chloroflexota bacterium]